MKKRSGQGSSFAVRLGYNGATMGFLSNRWTIGSQIPSMGTSLTPSPHCVVFLLCLPPLASVCSHNFAVGSNRPDVIHPGFYATMRRSALGHQRNPVSLSQELRPLQYGAPSLGPKRPLMQGWRRQCTRCTR